MFRLISRAAAALAAFGIAITAAAAGDLETCRDGQDEKAIAACSRMIKRTPSNPDYYYNRATIYSRIGEFDQAIADYGQAIRLKPNDAEAYRGRAVAYDGNDDYDRAIADFDRAIKLDPKSAQSYDSRGGAHERKGDYDRAIADYGEVIRLGPKSAGAYITRGNAYRGNGNFERALADYDQAIKLDPKQGYISRANAYRANGDFDRAIADFDQVIQLDPKQRDGYAARAIAYYEKGDFDHAIADVDQLIRLDPKRSEGYAFRGLIYLAKRDFDGAISSFDQEIKLDPKRTEGYLLRGLMYLAKRDYGRAIADYEQVIRIDPKSSSSANFLRDAVYLANGDYDRAIADLDQTIKIIDPKDSVSPAFVYSMRGAAYAMKGEHDRAIADLDRAIPALEKALQSMRSMPYMQSTGYLRLLDALLAHTGYFHPASAYAHRGYAFGRKGDFSRAMADLDKAIALNPKFARGYALRAAVQTLRGDAARVIADTGDAIRLDANDAFAWNIRGKFYLDRGQYALAAADFDQAIRLDPSLTEARQNRERVQALLQRPPGPDAPDAAWKPAASPERRVALVIGNSAYRAAPALPNPKRDAEAIAEALRQAGFQTVVVRSDLSRDAMRDALRTFRAAADNADWGVVYYAGHGIQIGRTNWLIPVDAKLADERDVQGEAIAYGELEAAVGGARLLRIIILDACRTDPFGAGMARRTSDRAVARGLGPPPEPDSGMLVVYSAKDGQIADDGDTAHSPFATALIAQLKVPGREVRRMFDYVRDEVMNATGRRQQPFTYGSVPASKDYYFVQGR
jgi:tetratricopeptide (TPR) repeat protein